MFGWTVSHRPDRLSLFYAGGTTTEGGILREEKWAEEAEPGEHIITDKVGLCFWFLVVLLLVIVGGRGGGVEMLISNVGCTWQAGCALS